MPNLYIIAGCNGAGKTTASYTILPEMLDCKEFVNADNIAAGLSPFNPEKAAIEAGRIMLAKIDALLLEGANFAIETTLATRSYVGLIRKAKVKNYKVTLLYFWLNSYQEAIQRVAIRVKNGGHFIPDDVVKRRYFRGVHYFFELYRFECDFWLMINTTNGTPLMVAEGEFNLEKVIYNDEIWNKIEFHSNDNQA